MSLSKSVHSRNSSARWTLQLPSPSNTSSTIGSSFLPNKSSADRLVPSPVTSGNNPQPQYCVFSPTFSNAPSVPSPKAIPRKRTPSITAFTTISSLSSSLELSLVLSNQGGGGGSFSNDSYLEKEFCKDFLCCDTVLSDLHELNQHIQQFHPELDPTAFSSSSAMNLLDSLFLHQFMQNSQFSDLPDTMGSTVALSPPNRDVSDASPKTSFYTPPTSLSPEMSPRTNTDSTLMSQMLMDFDDEAPAGGPFMFSDESGFVKINHQQHQKQPQQPYRFQQSRRDSADTVNVGCDDRGLVNAACPQGGAVDSLLAFEEAGEDVGRPGVFEGSAMGIDILERLERMGMHQQLSADDELEKSLTMILLQSEADGPLLNSGTVESRSPPAVPLVRFGPHHVDITTSSSSIALAEIYRQDDESEGSSPNANVKMSGVPTAIPSVVVPVQMFDFEESDKETSDSDAETSYSRDSMEVASFQIDLENWDLTGATNLFENPVRSTVATAAAHRARPAARRTLSMPMLSKLNKIKAGHAGVLGQSSNSSACVSKQLESKPTARSTKKMRVAAAGAAAALASRTLLDVETVASIITASSPILTPPHRTATPGAALRKAPMRRASLGSSGLASDIVDGADEHMATAVAGAGVAVCTTSALSASIAASRRAAAAVVANVGAIDDEDASIGSSSALGGRNDDDDADDADMFVFPKPRRSAGGASATAAGALGTSSRARKPSRSATMPATLTTPRATPTAVMKVRKAASGLSGVKEHMELDPAFARRFKSRTVAEQAAQTLEALREGATLADIVIRRLPKVKAGEERRLKLGSLSILDPHTLDKRFFCPVCKKEYKNANGLKYHLNHSHVEPNELPAGYYFGKKKKEAEDMSKPFVCTVRKCGKRYKNLNGLKYHIEHGHVLSADAKGDADPDASGASDESEEESDDS